MLQIGLKEVIEGEAGRISKARAVGELEELLLLVPVLGIALVEIVDCIEFREHSRQVLR